MIRPFLLFIGVLISCTVFFLVFLGLTEQQSGKGGDLFENLDEKYPPVKTADVVRKFKSLERFKEYLEAHHAE